MIDIKYLRFLVSKALRIKGHGISIIVPLSLSELDDSRRKNWEWLEKYWKSHLPGAEIIIGADKEAAEKGVPFSKSIAVNDGVSKAHGDVFVIIDADTYISTEAVLHCVKEIRLARKKNYGLWFVPYRKLFRLTHKKTKQILASDPKHPTPVPDTIQESDLINTGVFKGTPITEIGHWYGAMIQIMPREAFEIVGGWDHRFRGWGGEDHAAMVAMDTLYSLHRTLPTPVIHLWHPVVLPGHIDDRLSKRRLWRNQNPETTNDSLSGRYYWSNRHPDRMRKLLDECGNKHKHKQHQHKHPKHPTPPDCTSH